MLTSGSILCPVDFSDQSRQALQWATTIVQHRGGELMILTVEEPLLAEAARIRVGMDLAPQTERALRAFVEETLPPRVRNTMRIHLAAETGQAVEAILRAGRKNDVQMIVMGTHGRHGLRRLLLGSTTEAVLHGAECPLLAVPDGAAVHGDAVDGRLRKILLATDFGRSATAATQWAFDVAVEMRVPLVLAHVVEPVVVNSLWQPLIDDLDNERVTFGHRLLTKLSASAHDIPTERVVSIGQPAEAIAALAIEHGADLIVMGLAKAEGAEGHLAGSNAHQVLQRAHVPVVVVPADRCVRSAGRSGQ
jgi:nucleotide-binding universal stress UspA family protein